MIWLKLIRILTAGLFLLVFALTATAHSGRTDSSGGHRDRSTGAYHYHHGYPAHDHKDLDGDGKKDCPYDFDDQTDHSNHSQGTDKLVQEIKKQKESEEPEPATLREILSTIFSIVVLAWWVPFMVYGCICEHRRKRRK